MRHTKIVATLGPSSNTAEQIDALLVAGVDLFRLNFSHGTHESHRAVLALIRSACQRTGLCAAIMQDLSGPKIRTGRLPGGLPITLRERQELRIVAGDAEGGPGFVSTSFVDLIKSGIRPRDIVTRKALENAAAVVSASGGSTNAALHLPAIAHECGLKFDLFDVADVFKRTPYIADLKPGGRYVAKDMFEAGGVPLL